MDEIYDNKELYYFLADSAEEFEILFGEFDNTQAWLDKFNALVEKVNDSKIKHRIAPKMKDLIQIEDGSIEEKKQKAGAIIDEVKRQVFLTKRRLTLLIGKQNIDDVVYFDGWRILDKQVFIRDGRRLILQPQLAKVFTFIIQLDPSEDGCVIFTVSEILRELNAKLEKTELNRAYIAISKLNKRLCKFYGSRPIVGWQSSTPLEYTYIFHQKQNQII